ncbi:DUF86 domain-containing protein [Candidatus Desantisbacteria bacterium]|nr:DUF86 domain-containing protein [Candidatus Desantisbacteria bacterium]
MSFPGHEYLLHILDETKYILSQTKVLTKEDFMQNETLQRAFVRSIEIIGEATKNTPDNLKQKHPYIEWRAMAGMRDILIHDYFGIDYDIVWDVVINKIPSLHKEIEKIIQEENK